MRFTKREFLKVGGAAGAVAVAGLPASPAFAQSNGDAGLSSITDDAEPIGVDERLGRVAKAQRLMREQGIGAILIEPGTSMLYFTGIRWGRSERLTCVIIPATGEIGIVTPYFEEPSVRESMTFGEDVRTWHEHENPFERVAGILKDRGVNGPIGIEEMVRFFIPDGLAKAVPGHEIVSATPVVQGCRMYKSEHEIALMQKANEVTLRAYAHTVPEIEAGMGRRDVGRLIGDATAALGGSNLFALVLLGEASAYPHGSGQRQEVREGEVVLMDCGASVHGYQSDISRTFVYGEPDAHQRQVWETVKRGQELAFETMEIGRACGEIDDVVRAYYESLGYGPGYQTPGLSHRLGHGIGMDGHERVNFVHGETTPLAPGMCFSNEPGIYIFGEFGIRLEDCVYMADDGPRWFGATSPSIDDPVGLG